MTDEERAQEWTHTRIEPAFHSQVSGELARNLRVYTQSRVILMLAAYGAECERLGMLKAIEGCGCKDCEVRAKELNRS